MTRKENLRRMWEALGRMTSTFAMLDLTMHHLVWGLIGVGNPAGRAVTDRMTVLQLVELTERLVDEGIPRDEGRRERVRRVVAGVKRVNEDRNRFTHALLAVEESGPRMARIREVVRGRDAFEAVDVSHVDNLRERCGDLVGEMAVLWGEMVEEVGAVRTFGDLWRQEKQE